MSIGSQLKQAREGKGISIQDASAKTKIQERFLEAIEDDEFSTLPNPLYVKWFVKKYAEFLDLDVKALAEQFENAGIKNVKQIIDLKAEELPPVSSERYLKKTLTVIVVLLVIIGLVLFLLSSNKGALKSKRPSSGIPQAKRQDAYKNKITIAKAKPGVNPVRELRSLTTDFSNGVKPDTTGRFVAKAQIIKAKQIKLVHTGPTPAPNPSKNTDSIQLPNIAMPKNRHPEIFGMLNLSVIAKKPCRLCVKADAKLLFDDFLAVGASDKWQAKDRFELDISDPAAVGLVLNGRRLILAGRGARRKVVITKDGISR